MEKEADDLAAKAEHKHDFVCIMKSNSLQKTVKQKLVDIQALEPAAGKYPAAVQGQLIHQQPLNLLYVLYIVQTVTEQRTFGASC